MSFADFSALCGAAAGAKAVPPLQPREEQDPPSPEPASHSSPAAPPAVSPARMVRPAAPPFSWLGGDAWPALPGAG